MLYERQRYKYFLFFGAVSWNNFTVVPTAGDRQMLGGTDQQLKILGGHFSYKNGQKKFLMGCRGSL